jgi:hypothetical protein
MPPTTPDMEMFAGHVSDGGPGGVGPAGPFPHAINNPSTASRAVRRKLVVGEWLIPVERRIFAVIGLRDYIPISGRTAFTTTHAAEIKQENGRTGEREK